MSSESTSPVVVFGKLSGLGIILMALAALLAASSIFLYVDNYNYVKSTPELVPLPEISESDFQLVQLSEYRRDQFLLDKSTGRVWQNVCSGKVAGPDCNGMIIWSEMYVDGITPSDSTTAKIFRQQLLDGQ